MNKRPAILLAFGIAAAFFVLAGCVPSEEDFKEDHPPPGSSTTPNPSGSNLVCLSSLPGSGTLASPASLGTAPVCFRPAPRTTDIYYSLIVPNTGLWFFQIVNMTDDFDIIVYSGTSFAASTILCFSGNGGTADDACSFNVDPAGLGGILVENFTGSSTALYRLEVVQ